MFAPFPGPDARRNERGLAAEPGRAIDGPALPSMLGGVRIRRLRAERFGAIVATDEPPALVSVDRALARKLGAEGGALWEAPSPGLDVSVLEGPTEVHLAVTERCPAGCSGCYADARPDGHAPTLDELKARLDALADLGAFSVAFGGGEGALREDLPALVAHARARGLTPTLTTSGLGVDAARARALAGLAQVNVSWDGPAEVYEAVRGYRGAPQAERAVRHLQAAGVPVGLNTVLTRENVGQLEAIGEGAEALGAVELQLLRFKPSGRGSLDYLARRLTPAQVEALPGALRRLSARHPFALRVDCAMVPFLAADPEVGLEALQAFGVMGCEAGRSLMTVDAHGRTAPCSFWRDAPGASFGAGSWAEDPSLERFREHAAAAPEPCASCPVRRVCRGGCRIVAGLAGDPWRPDPECPRVRAHATADS
ncbi:MAG: hypothetical protein CMN29_01790 [Sandaracinus sp.]|nr:hypothetical protein [Sandaracinus sp.]